MDGTVYLGADGLPVLPAEEYTAGPRGWIELASAEPDPVRPPEWHFFRSFFRDLLMNLIRGGQGDFRQLQASPEHLLPASADLQKLMDAAPPIPGDCLLTPELLQKAAYTLYLWLIRQMDSAGIDAVSSFLSTFSPQWTNVGRISFHLAENKKDPDGHHPFVFLAAYLHRVGEDGREHHLPLASALKQYSAEKHTLLEILRPIQAAAAKSPFLGGLLETKKLFSPCVWNPFEAQRFVADIPVFQDAGIIVRITDLWSGRKPRKLQAEVTLDLPQPGRGRLAGSLLTRFSVSAAIGDQKLSEEEWTRLLKSGGGLIRIKGQWVDADVAKVEAILKRWRDAGMLAENASLSFLQSLRLLAGAGRLPGNETLPAIQDDLCRVTAGPSLAEVLNGVAGAVPEPDRSRYPETVQLRQYQLEGVRFLYRMGCWGAGACIADDMGLGKTIQVLVWLDSLRQEGTLNDLPALAVVPASLLNNWKNEGAKFTPDIRLALLHPSGDEWHLFPEDPEEWLRKYDLVVTTYSMAARLEQLKDFQFPVIVIDEAQNIKNATSGQSRAVRQLQGIRRVAMTGTPVENNLGDLWSIFDFLNPGLLGTLSDFKEWISAMGQGHDGKPDYTPLRKLIRPFILRRTKSDKSILADLPEKTERKVFCHLTAIQALIYRRTVDAMKRELELCDGMKRKGVILSYLIQFKQICNHPSQFTGNGEYLTERSGKFLCLKLLAEQIRLKNEKVLVFTQFREMIDPIQELLTQVFHRPGLIIHGGTPVRERAEKVASFQKEDGPPFFVLSLKAAGTGLTLTKANHVIHFDRWWNPAVEDQASDRAYRIGQHRNVLIHKLICSGTIEEKIDSLIAGKKALADSLLQNGPEKVLTEMTNGELLDFVALRNPDGEPDGNPETL